MLDLPPSFLAVLQRQAITEDVLLVWLVEFPGLELYYALAPEGVEFDGTTYTANNGTFDVHTINLEGQEPELRLELQNLDNAWGELTDERSLRGQPVVVRLVSLETIDDPDAQLEIDSLVVGEHEVTRESIVFKLQLPSSALGYTVPKRQMAGERINTTSPEEWWGNNMKPARRR